MGLSKRQLRAIKARQKSHLSGLIGNVYRNIVTGNEWKIEKMNGNLITLKNKQGTKFDTTPQLMGNYVYVGRDL